METKFTMGQEQRTANGYRVDLDKLYSYLDNHGEKFKKMNVLEIVKDVYTFTCVLIGIEVEDLKNRVNYLTEQNLKWFNKAETAEKELELCRKKLSLLEEKADTNQKSTELGTIEE